MKDFNKFDFVSVFLDVKKENESYVNHVADFFFRFRSDLNVFVCIVPYPITSQYRLQHSNGMCRCTCLCAIVMARILWAIRMNVEKKV